MLLRLLLCCFAFLLASCFDVREEYWIERNGSGRARFDYDFPSEALLVVGGAENLESRIRRVFEETPEIHLDQLAFAETGSDTRLTLLASTDAMFSLLDLKESEAFKALPSASTEFAGHFEVKVRGLDIDVRRTLEFQRALGLASLAVGSEQRSQRRLSYIIHLPKPAISHNAGRTEDDGRTLIWEYSLGEALARPIVTEFRSRLPIPWWAWAGIALLLTLPPLLLYSWIRRRRMGKSDPSSSP